MDKSETPNPKSEMGRKPVIGLCGGVGAGKTTVAAEFARLGGSVLDSDRQARQVLAQPEVVEQIRRWWGEGVLDEAGRPVRERIAECVFGRPDEVARLNELIHPRVRRMRRRRMAEQADDPDVVAFVLDTPLLFEAGVHGECDATVFVDAPRRQREERVRASRGWDGAELERRQRHQMDPEAKRARCDYVIHNDGSAAALARQVRGVLDEVLRRADRGRGSDEADCGSPSAVRDPKSEA